MNPSEYCAIEKFATDLKRVLQSRMDKKDDTFSIIKSGVYACCVDIIDIHLDLARLDFEADINKMESEHYKHREEPEKIE